MLPEPSAQLITPNHNAACRHRRGDGATISGRQKHESGARLPGGLHPPPAAAPLPWAGDERQGRSGRGRGGRHRRAARGGRCHSGGAACHADRNGPGHGAQVQGGWPCSRCPAQQPRQLQESLPVCCADPRPCKPQGKVRDTYDLGDKLVVVTTDRQSAFDRLLASVPFKGQVGAGLREGSAGCWRDLVMPVKGCFSRRRSVDGQQPAAQPAACAALPLCGPTHER